MQRLLYISTARTTVTQDMIDDILRVSRRNNAAAGITGLLVVGGKRFLQVLEGTDLAIAQTFDRIQRDPRHFAMVNLARQSITERSFGDWAMGYHTGGTTTSDDPSTMVAALIAPIEDATLRGYFSGFADLHMATKPAKAA
ncbi:BLUF domain-containing protein [Sphingomonas sp. R86520]|uniref:BLUF domain-containing protein n=1 Tax=Sphingomonas sp. R86520 TaxID=3093859 RepID=UPI0036D2737C